MQLLKFTPTYRARYSARLFCLAGLAAVLLAGCGDSSTDAPALQGAKGTGLHGTQTVTIHIPGMVERLKLM